MNPLSVVRSDALLDPELQKCPAVYMTLAAITTFTTRRKDGYCYFKQETIAKELGKSRQAISQHLRKLSDLGYVEIIQQNYRGFKSNNAYRIKYDGPIERVASSPCNDESSPCITTQAHLATKCSSINAKEEKEPLTRFSFCREINNAFKAGSIGEEFDHLDEIEIVNAAGACCDWMELNLKYPDEGKAVYQLRTWLRKGMQNGAIRKAPKAAKEGREENSADNLPEWQQEALSQGIFDDGEFKSWIAPLEWNGNGKLFAPTNFHAKTVEERYRPQIERALHAEIIITVKPKELQQ